jgi:ketosteroid isomerase-like protein
MDWSNRVREILNAVDKNDSEKFATYLTTDAEFKFGNGPAVVGSVAISQGVSDFLETLGGIRHNILNVWHDRNYVVAQLVTDYTRKDGQVVSIPVVDVFRLRGDLIESYLIYADITPVFS